MRPSHSLLITLVLIIISVPLMAQDSTTVVIRAQSRDAKFIGTSMGGVQITIADAQTGELLAEGVAEGSTGDTDRLVRNPKERYGQLHTEGAAKYETTLSLEDPTLVTVSATGPLAQRQSSVTSSTQLWLIPGKDITGDGIVLEMPGLAIDIMQPQAHERTSQQEITIRANLVMMCGCATEPGGMWDSSQMEIKAVIQKDGEKVEERELSFAGKASTYETVFKPAEPGAYLITVYGYDPRTGNTGVDKTTVIVN